MVLYCRSLSTLVCWLEPYFGVLAVIFGVESKISTYIMSIPANSIHRYSFNVTLLIAGIFGLASGGSHNFVTLASLLALVGVGVGGNMPVDSAVFLGE